MKKILFVDDYVELVQFFSLLLAEKEFDIRTAINKKELELVFQNYVPDIIFLDVKFDGLDGRNICRKIKSNSILKSSYIVIMSAHHSWLDNFAECGADDILAKPFGLSEVFEIIDRSNASANDRNLK